MRVFVWNSYGVINVYSIETKQQREKLLKEMTDSFELYDDDIKKQLESIEPFVDDAKKFENRINAIVSEFKGQVDQFEYGTDFSNVIE